MAAGSGLGTRLATLEGLKVVWLARPPLTNAGGAEGNGPFTTDKLRAPPAFVRDGLASQTSLQGDFLETTA